MTRVCGDAMLLASLKHTYVIMKSARYFSSILINLEIVDKCQYYGPIIRRARIVAKTPVCFVMSIQ